MLRRLILWVNAKAERKCVKSIMRTRGEPGGARVPKFWSWVEWQTRKLRKRSRRAAGGGR